MKNSESWFLLTFLALVWLAGAFLPHEVLGEVPEGQTRGQNQADSDAVFEMLVDRAKKKARSQFRRPKKIANADFDFGNPPEARGLVFAEALEIVPKGPIVENEGTGYSAYPRRGTAWERCRIFYQREADGEFVEHLYSPDLVRYDSPNIKPPLPAVIPPEARHWTELGIFASFQGGFPQLVNMRANGYMRISSGNTVYGHSERAFVEQESLDNRARTRQRRESFPLMTEVYVAYPVHNRCNVYQIYENETGVMARHLKIMMGKETVIDVKGVLLPRRNQAFHSRQNIGMAHISMYWKGERERAPAGTHAHDSDTVGVTYKDGQSRVFPIPKSRERAATDPFVFVDLEDGQQVSGYSLLQRDRTESNYLPGVDYHRRASMRITNLQWSVPIETQLIVLPHDGEFFDNVVLRTVIRPTNRVRKAITFSYTETVGEF